MKSALVNQMLNMLIQARQEEMKPPEVNQQQKIEGMNSKELKV